MGHALSKIEEIEQVIEALPEEEYAKLRLWFSEKDWQKRDSQLQKDASAGKLDFLIDEARVVGRMELCDLS